MKREQKIKISKDGPYMVSGGVPLDKQIIGIGKDGEPDRWIQGEKLPKKESCGLCRCGMSKTKPYCDGSHMNGFDGTETASREKFEKQMEVVEGPELILKDVPELCAAARFCHRAEGTWELTRRSDDPKARKIAIEEACNCPSGRLVMCDKSGKVFEKKFEPSMSLVEDPQNKVSGPLWVRGGIQVEAADGFLYEKRNRCTLCRCGKSDNKPFCDGTHIEVGFSDNDKSLRKK